MKLCVLSAIVVLFVGCVRPAKPVKPVAQVKDPVNQKYGNEIVLGKYVITSRYPVIVRIKKEIKDEKNIDGCVDGKCPIPSVNGIRMPFYPQIGKPSLYNKSK